MNLRKRNNNIDFLRGIAALCIVIIHTAFWSGESYLPKWFINLTLFVDVPVFIFISGLTYQYNSSILKSIKGIINIWKKWLIFILLFVVILLITKYQLSFDEIVPWLFFSFKKPTTLPVVPGSIWYIPMYIKVLLISGIIIILNKKYGEDDKSIKNIIIFFMLIFGIAKYQKISMILDELTIFYSMFFMIGYYAINNKIDGKKLTKYLFINILLTIIIMKLYGANISSLQNFKFPPDLPYFFFSMNSILIFWYLKDKLNITENNIINKLGENALFCYFSQGIGSSIIIMIASKINVTAPIKFILLLMINLSITLALTLILCVIEKLLKIIVEKRCKHGQENDK